MKPRYLLILGSLLALLLGAMLFFPADEGPSQPVFNRVKVSQGQIRSVVSATGTLSPMVTVQVGSQVSGTIQTLDADFNDPVKKGQRIAQIDPAVYQAKLAEAEANLQSAKASRDKARVAVEEAARKLTRQQEMAAKKLASESDLDIAHFAHEAAKVEHRVREAAVGQAQASADLQRVNLEYTRILSPIDGVVVSRSVDVGQTVAASFQAPILFTIAQDLTRMQIETDVDEAFIGTIQEGQPVGFTVFAYPKRTFEGRVSQVRLQPKVDAGVVKYNCIIRVDNGDLALKPGMTATVSIDVAHKDGVLKAPNAALRYVPPWPGERLRQLRAELKADEAFVWIADGDEVTPIKVRTGIIGEQETEISGEGLSPGLAILSPLKREESGNRRRFGLSLF